LDKLPEPITVLVWIFVSVFFLTAAITIGGIIENFHWIKVPDKYLKGLHTALLIEIAIAGIALATSSIENDSIVKNTDKLSLLENEIDLLKKENILLKSKLTNDYAHNLNTDFSRRDQIIGINPDWEISQKNGVVNFDSLSYSQLKLLLEGGFINSLESQNEGPSVYKFLGLMKEYPEITAGGYAVSPYRNDYRVTLDSIQMSEKTSRNEALFAFTSFCQGAEVIGSKETQCWWD